jgi:ubiquinone/menaquinone biosynthesis C-methylase UbiE
MPRRIRRRSAGILPASHKTSQARCLRCKRPWYETAFAKDYLDRYRHRSDEAAAAELPFLRSALALPRGARVLDLCCGAGRYARALASAGYAVVGVDLSADLLRVARSRSRGRNIRCVRADMRALPLADESLDGAVSMFTSFGYFATDAENARVLHEIARVLKPGAPFVMDYMNLRVTLATLVPASQRMVNGVRLDERRRFDARRKRLVKTIRIACCKGDEVLRESVRAYTPHELTALFKRAGLTVKGRYGDLSGAAFDPAKSPRCVLVARKA